MTTEKQTRAKKAKGSTVQKMTLDQFKIFIEGLAFFNEDWYPNKEQWKQIKLLINNLIIPEPVQQLQVNIPSGPISHVPSPEMQYDAGSEVRTPQRQFLGNSAGIPTRPKDELLPPAIGTASDFA